MNRKQAIGGSLNKWNDICYNRADMSEAMKHCLLCRKYKCVACPLGGVGKACGGRPWRNIYKILWNINADVLGEKGVSYAKIGTLSEQGDTELVELCNEMRDTLQSLYNEEE